MEEVEVRIPFMTVIDNVVLAIKVDHQNHPTTENVSRGLVYNNNVEDLLRVKMVDDVGSQELNMGLVNDLPIENHLFTNIFYSVNH